jgi:hypothetical protein
MYRDSAGYYFFVGRANDMMKPGGFWVSPAEEFGLNKLSTKLQKNMEVKKIEYLPLSAKV